VTTARVLFRVVMVCFRKLDETEKVLKIEWPVEFREREGIRTSQLRRVLEYFRGFRDTFGCVYL